MRPGRREAGSTRRIRGRPIAAGMRRPVTAQVRAGLILRVVNGRVPPGMLETVRAALERDLVPVARRQAGLDRFLTAVRPTESGHEIALMTVWSDLESALTAFGGNLTAVRTIDGVGHGEILDSVDFYEVETGGMRLTGGTPRFLRLTAGTVGRGLDADIQRDLRSRIADLGPELVDAYVGRRVKGSSVELAFISTWTAAAAGRDLDEPIWPEISAQYDVFAIRVFDVLLEGSHDP
jgi:hypothetical protein